MKKYVNGEYIEMTEEEIREIEEAKKQADAERTGAEEDILNKLGG